MSLPDMALINYAMIKMNKTGIYSKALARWNVKKATDHIIWENLRNHMIAEYEKFLSKCGGTTLPQEGYGTAFHKTEGTDENFS